MNPRPYFLASAALFGLVAVLHLIRIVNGWAFQFGPWAIPTGLSWLAFLIPGALCLWGLRLATASER